MLHILNKHLYNVDEMSKQRNNENLKSTLYNVTDRIQNHPLSANYRSDFKVTEIIKEIGAFNQYENFFLHEIKFRFKRNFLFVLFEPWGPCVGIIDPKNQFSIFFFILLYYSESFYEETLPCGNKMSVQVETVTKIKCLF